MLKFFNYNKKNSQKNLQIILNKRKFIQKKGTLSVKSIILDVKKNGDKAIIKYEKKFSKVNIKSNKIVADPYHMITDGTKRAQRLMQFHHRRRCKWMHIQWKRHGIQARSTRCSQCDNRKHRWDDRGTQHHRGR